MIEMYNEIPEHRGNNLIQAYSYDVGFDIRAGQACKIPPRTSSPLLYTGLHICFPCWLCGHIRPRPHQIKRDILTEGTIDPGYTGAIRVKLFNFSWSEPYQFEKGEKIAQPGWIVIHWPDPCTAEWFRLPFVLFLLLGFRLSQFGHYIILPDFVFFLLPRIPV